MKKTTIAMLSVPALLLGTAAILAARYIPRPEKPQKDKTRVACIGDSITFGAGVPKTRKRDAWAYVLERELGPAYQVINYGFSGATLQREGDLPYRRLRFLEKMKRAEPAVILFMLGTNDSKPYNWDAQRYREQFEELVQELLEGAWPHKLVLLAPPKAFAESKTGKIAFDIVNETIGHEIRQSVISVGEKQRLQVVDLYAFTEDHPEYFDDGVHPNVLGNKAIAEHLHRVIQF